MKYLIAVLVLFMTSAGVAQTSGPKPQKVVDVVFKIQKVKDKSLISFHRAPTIYEVVSEQTDAMDILGKLESSQKNNKAVEVTVDNLSRRILDVKAP